MTIPSSVEEIGSNVFTSCPGLRSLVIENCGLEFDAGAQQVDESIVSQPAHTYSGGECTVCGHKDSDYVIVGSAELHDGYYTVDGTNVVSGNPESASLASYAYYSNSVLYLYDFSYTGTGGTQSSNAVIKPNSGGLTVSLFGSSTIGGEGYGFYSNVGSITFKSTSDTEQGILTVSAYVNTIYGSSSSEIVIDNVIIKSSGANIYSGISTTIKNGANIEASGISSGNMITISYSTVVVESTGTAMVAGGLYIIASEITLNGKLQVGEGTINPATNGTWQIDYGNSATEYSSMTYSSELSIADEKNNRNWGSCTYFRIAEHVHTYTSEVTKEATCTSTGTTTYTCTLCNNSYEETIKKVAHTVVTDEAVEATCTETGLTEGSHCSVCYEVIVEQTVVAAKGHTKVTDEAVEATCTETGLTEGSHCSVCNEVFVAQTVVAATGHSYEAVVTEPTCTEGGYTTYTCSVCGDTYTADETAATGHSYTVSWSWDGTSAMATVSCSDCGDSYEQQAAITTQSNYGQTIYIAIVRVGDVTYTTSKTTGTITIPTTDSTSEVITEEVETTEPVEGTDTETEVDEEAEDETNPTTGMVLALLPMAIAMAGAVAGKKRLG